MTENQEGNHALNLCLRKKLKLSGVEDVTGFDESTVLVRTTMGTLVIGGEGLHVEKIDPDAGIMELDGKINEMCYSDSFPASSLWKRLFG